MNLDPAILSSLMVPLSPRAYLRMTPLIHTATPLGAGYGMTRFASPTKTFKVIYLAEDFATSIAETIIRDRFQRRATRRLMQNEFDLWGVTEVNATAPLTLADLRTPGPFLLGVSTNSTRAKSRRQGRSLSQAIHDQSNADGLLYVSRITGGTCICIFDRALPGSLIASPVMPVTRAAAFTGALATLRVVVIAAP